MLKYGNIYAIHCADNDRLTQLLLYSALAVVELNFGFINSPNVYILDLVLRNNITTEQHPLGVYHPHDELHHIKKENIGLIEVMGLAVLPARLKEELAVLADALISGSDIYADPRIEKHADWAQQLKQQYTFTAENAMGILQKEVGIVFSKVLEHASVYKRDENGKQAFLRFIQSI